MIPLFRVAANLPRINELQAQVWASGYVGEGQMVARFEDGLADVLHLPPHSDGEPRILAVNSCSAALDMALHLAGVGPGDEVISSPLTCTATNGAIVNRGATIVWADVERETGNIDPRSVAERVRLETRAIIAVDWSGRRCDYRQLWIGSEDTPVIRDAAHSFLAIPGRNIFEEADYTCYSFGPIKHLTCGGYGGALITPPEQTQRARLLRWHGLDRRSSADFRCAQNIEEAGYRYHLTDDLAAVGLANLEMVEKVVKRHRENAARLHHALAGIDGVLPPPPDPGASWWFYDLRIEGDRDQFSRDLADAGVASSPVHASNTKHSAFKRQSRGDTPNADWYDRHHLAIPCGWWLTESDLDQIASAVTKVARKMRAEVAV